MENGSAHEAPLDLTVGTVSNICVGENLASSLILSPDGDGVNDAILLKRTGYGLPHCLSYVNLVSMFSMSALNLPCL